MNTSQIPSHNHDVSDRTADGRLVNLAGWYAPDNGSYWPKVSSSQGASDTDNLFLTTHHVGGGQAHGNMPPYVTVYQWLRVS